MLYKTEKERGVVQSEGIQELRHFHFGSYTVPNGNCCCCYFIYRTCAQLFVDIENVICLDLNEIKMLIFICINSAIKPKGFSIFVDGAEVAPIERKKTKWGYFSEFIENQYDGHIFDVISSENKLALSPIKLSFFIRIYISGAKWNGRLCRVLVNNFEIFKNKNYSQWLSKNDAIIFTLIVQSNTMTRKSCLLS